MKKKKGRSSAKPRTAARDIHAAKPPIHTPAAMITALKRLNRASAQLWRTQNLHTGLDEILSATIELLGADFGNIQIFDPRDCVLRIAVHRGFNRMFLEHFREVSTKDNAACGRALRRGQRIIIEDIEKDAAFEPHRKIARSAGYRAVQSTPLIAHDGRPLGMISTHFRVPHRPSELDLQSLDLYVRQATDFIERCGVEQALRESRGSLEGILNSLSAQIAVVDAKGEILMVNEQWRRFARQHAVKPEQVSEGANYFAVCELAVRNGAAEAGEFLKGMRAVLAGRKRDYSLEYPCHSPGIERWFIARVTRFIGCGAPRVVVAHEDITARKLAELALRDREEKLQFTLDAAAAGAWTWNSKTNESAWDDRFHALYGLTRKHPRTFQTWVSCIHKDDRSHVLAEIEKVRCQPGNSVWDVEFRAVRPDGTVAWHHGLGHAVRDDQGRVVRLTGINTDITARKEAECMLREGELRMRAFLENSNVIAWLKDEQGRYVFLSENYQRRFGLEGTDWKGKSDFELWPRKIAQEFRRNDRAVLVADAASEVIESTIDADGKQLWWLNHKFTFRDASGRRYVGGLGVDITARKLAETALSGSEERYRLLAEHTDDFVALSDAERNVLYLSPSYERKLDVTLAGLRSHGGRSWMHPDDEETIRHARAANLAGKSTTIEYRFLKKKTGEWLWLEGRCTPIRDASGRVAKLLLVSRDITARKAAEAALLESEERYRQLVHSLPAAVYTCDASGRITLYNAEAVKLWGREPSVKDRWDASHRVLDAEGRPMKRSQLAIAEAVRSGEPLRGMERIVERADGSRSHVLCFPDPLHDAGRRTVGAVSMLVDITTLKETQARLHAALAELQTLSHAVKQSPAMVVITSPEGSIEYVNPKFTSVTGYTSAEVLGRNPRLLKSGEQPQSFYETMWETISAGKEWRGEFCNRKKNGELFWEYAVIAPIMEPNGKIRHFVAIKEDITEHRRAVMQLHEREERVRSILNTVVDAVITIDKRGIIIGVNPATERLFGYTEAEMIGRNVKMLMPSPYREEHDGYLRNYHRTGKARIIGIGREAQARRKDGSIFPIELVVSQVDHMHIYTGVIRDITARRALENEILDISENERAAIGEDLHDDLGQQVAGLWCMSQVLYDSLKKREAPETAEAAKMSKILGQVLALTRSLAQGLHPVALETGGLVAALKDLAARTRLMFGVLCRFHGINRDTGLDQPTTTNLFRICQEAVTNAAKHAQAAHIDITLSRKEGRIVLTVRDDGCGLPESLPANRGMGMRIMQHRASLIGAELSIDHAPLGGTLMTCKIHPKTARCTK